MAHKTTQISLLSALIIAVLFLCVGYFFGHNRRPLVEPNRARPLRPQATKNEESEVAQQPAAKKESQEKPISLSELHRRSLVGSLGVPMGTVVEVDAEIVRGKDVASTDCVPAAPSETPDADSTRL